MMVGVWLQVRLDRFSAVATLLPCTPLRPFAFRCLTVFDCVAQCTLIDVASQVLAAEVLAALTATERHQLATVDGMPSEGFRSRQDMSYVSPSRSFRMVPINPAPPVTSTLRLSEVAIATPPPIQWVCSYDINSIFCVKKRKADLAQPCNNPMLLPEFHAFSMGSGCADASRSVPTTPASYAFNMGVV